MWADLLNALAFLTILPVKFRETATPGRMLAFAPLVGLLIGVAVSAAGMLPVRPELRALAALALWVGLTGGLHLDGLRTRDGLLAAVDPERHLAIMHDPRAGRGRSLA
jgi:adenosylcobinamide-GDP ribazoletransferase